MNSFFASVELLENPELCDKPVAVAGDPKSRHGIILAKNEIAKSFMIHTAETVISAKRKCPDLILLSPHHDKYRHYSKLINHIYLKYTDLVEPFSIDESWLDVTACEKLFGKAEDIADEIRNRIKKELGLTLSVGVSFNKVFAKMGSDYKKPDATTIITRENFKKLLWRLPTEQFFFVGKTTSKKLASIGIHTVGEIANANPAMLKELLGVYGEKIYRYTNGLDSEPVKRYGEKEMPKSIGHGITFKRDLENANDISLAMTELATKVGSRLRRSGMKAYGVKVEITDASFMKFSRQRSLATPISTAAAIKRNAMELLRTSNFAGRSIRLITVTAINLEPEHSDEQLTMFSLIDDAAPEQDSEKEKKLELTIDDIKEKFGSSSINYAHYLDNDIGITD